MHCKAPGVMELLPELAVLIQLEIAITGTEGNLSRSNRQGFYADARHGSIDELTNPLNRSDLDLGWQSASHKLFFDICPNGENKTCRRQQGAIIDLGHSDPVLLLNKSHGNGGLLINHRQVFTQDGHDGTEGLLQIFVLVTWKTWRTLALTDKSGQFPGHLHELPIKYRGMQSFNACKVSNEGLQAID